MSCNFKGGTVDGEETSSTSWRLVVYPSIYMGFMVFYTSQVVIAGVLNHQEKETCLAISVLNDF